MAVGLERRLDVLMAEALAHQQDGGAQADEQRGVRVPLWHNKGKSENPCGATG